MLRKHLNSIPAHCYRSGNVPFYSWQCLTIQLEGRDVDLVIKDQVKLFELITVLVYYLKTIDGKKDTAVKLLHYMSPDLEIENTIRKQVVASVVMKYKVMKLRHKISYLAFEQKMTVYQLLLNAIVRTYTQLIIKGEIPVSLTDLYKLQYNNFTLITQLKASHALQHIMKTNIACFGIQRDPLIDLSKYRFRHTLVQGPFMEDEDEKYQLQKKMKNLISNKNALFDLIHFSNFKGDK